MFILSHDRQLWNIEENRTPLIRRPGGHELSMELATAAFLDRNGIRLLACKPVTIDRASRQLFKDTMEKLNQPAFPPKMVGTCSSTMAFADVIGYPFIVRLSVGGTGARKSWLARRSQPTACVFPPSWILVEKCIAG